MTIYERDQLLAMYYYEEANRLKRFGRRIRWCMREGVSFFGSKYEDEVKVLNGRVDAIADVLKLFDIEPSENGEMRSIEEDTHNEWLKLAFKAFQYQASKFDAIHPVWEEYEHKF